MKRFINSVLIAALLILLIPISHISAAPATAYWVGDSGNWSDATNHWATSSGGAPDAGNTPGSSTDCIFDANSFSADAQTVTVDATAYCKNMNWSAIDQNVILTSGNFNITDYNGFVLDPMLTVNMASGYGIRTYGAGNMSLDQSGATITRCRLRINGTGTVTMQSDWISSADSVYIESGTLDTNGKTITIAANFGDNSSASVRTLTLTGSSIINCTGWIFGNGDTANLTINKGSSSIRVTGTGNFQGCGKDYAEVQLTGNHTITGSSSFDSLIINRTSSNTITFTDGTTQTVTSMTCPVSGSYVTTITGSGAAGWNITSGGATITLDKLAIHYSTAAGGTWIARFSTDLGDNSGWTFAFNVSAVNNITPSKVNNLAWGDLSNIR